MSSFINLSQIEANDWVTAKEGAEYVHAILGHKNKTANFIAFAKYHGIHRIKPTMGRFLYNMDDLDQTISWLVLQRS